MVLTQQEVQLGFARQLKSWRAARKLSQLELAMSAGVSQRHISFLEVGRAQPSREMVAQLAAALDIPLREQNLLLSAAGFAPAHTETALDEPGMAPVRAALEMMLTHHEPFPATVADRAWNLLQANAAMGCLLRLAGDVEAMWARVCPEGTRNLMKLTLHPDGLRSYISNWEDVAAEVMTRTRREAEVTGSAALQALLDEVASYPGIRAEWQLSQWGQSPAPVLPVDFHKDGLELRLFTMVATFGTPQDITTDELRVESYFPADAATDTILRKLSQAAA
ncbi:MAG: helix-turn-helix transcriptional regulator [Abyssibacter sp.]|nr:helix-turn-helix transcriptional regulator [Abyssibacter sp.]